MGTGISAGQAAVTVIAATRRLARQITMRYDKRQAESGAAAWRPLDVLPWNAWVDRCWQRLADAGHGDLPLALSEVQESLIWEEAARQSVETLGELLMPRELAREARRAWHLAAEYGIGREEMLRAGGAETRSFLRMAGRVEDRLDREGWCSQDQRQVRVARHHDLDRAAQGVLVLAGFDDLTPAQAAVVGALESAGIELGMLALPRREARIVVQRCQDPEMELRQSVMAARRWVEDRENASVGIVVPDLELVRAEVEQILDDVLCPDRVLPGAPTTARPWGVSLGCPLSDWPVVECALRLLVMLFRGARFTDLGLLLRSPFWGATEELPRRGLLDGWLREEGVYQTDVAALANLLARSSHPRLPACPDLLGRLQSLAALHDRLPGLAPPERWAVLFGEILTAAGWPGQRTLDSGEYQCVAKWHETLSSLASTGQVSGPMDAASCVDRLARLAAETTFQPESPEPPVQVLGLLETAGLSFDVIWMAGMHHLAWPRPVRPNPWIPAALQRTHRLPRSCAEVELEFARRRMAAAAESASELIYSWPAKIEDEAMRPSALLAGLGECSEPPAGWRSIASQQMGGDRLERLEDYRLQPLPRGTRARGGSSVVRRQSACPFQAQAKARLESRSLEQPGPGVSAMESGQIAHLALQWLWQDWGSRDVPAAMDPAARTAAVEGAARRACRRLLAGSGDLRVALERIESRRAASRILALLEQDLARATFVAEAVERVSLSEFQGVTFELRIDRVDRLDDGTLLLIDYKTGQTRLSDWHGERPREPQLPFYAVAADLAPVSGVAFGCLRTGEEGYAGYGTENEAGTGIQAVAEMKKPPEDQASWEGLFSLWARRLRALVDEFAAGEARVDPRSVAQDCRYCDLAPLCRRHELALDGGGVDE